MSHDASATWSGFNYQGKVALFHTLRKISQKLSKSQSFDFSGYELILENHEDFDIRGPNGFKSFHQVKAMNKTAFYDYENALFAMLLQLDSPVNSPVIGYLHTWKPLSWNGNSSFDQKLRGVIKTIIDEHINTPKTSFIKKTFTKETGVHKKVKILRQALKKDTRLVDEESVLRVLNQAYDSLSEESVALRVKQYDYGYDDGTNELACSIASIDKKVKNAISRIHDIRNINSDDVALDRVFCKLLAKLDENIISKHSDLNSRVEHPITFNEVLDIVVDERTQDSDQAYLESRFKLVFISTFEEFIDDEDLCTPSDAEAYSNKDENSNLNSAMEVLLDLSASDLLDYFRKLNPHISLDSNIVVDIAMYIDLPNLKQYLFSIFRDMCLTKFSHKQTKKMILYESGKKRYLPTTIGAQTKKDLVKNIMNNSHAISILFEAPAMLTGCEHAHEISCFADEYSKISEVKLNNAYEGEGPKEGEKISQISSDIRLIKVSTAIEEMKNA